MNTLTRIEEFVQLIEQEDKISIGIFRAEWCGDCHFIDSFMDSIAQKYTDTVSVVNIDIEEFPDLSKKLAVIGIPSFVAFHKGEEIHRFVSRMRKTRSEIDTFFQEALAKKE